MATYLITGANRGIGLEFVSQFGSDPKNKVIGLVRNQSAAEKAAATQGCKDNVTFIEADLTNYKSLKKASLETSRLTNGKLDYLIANAAIVSEWSAFDDLETLGQTPEALETDLMESFRINVIGNIHLFNLFLPLIRQGTAKKIITLSTGMADIDFISTYNFELAGPYAITKAGMNMAVAKYSAKSRDEGILFMSISPGLVETGHHSQASDEQLSRIANMGKKFVNYAPEFSGPLTPKESVEAMRRIIDNSSIESGAAGSFVSHLGSKQWL